MQKNPAENKPSFVLHKDFWETLSQLSDEQAGQVFKAIFIWQLEGELPDMEKMLKLVVTPLVLQFKRDNAKWAEISAKRSVYGAYGAKQKLAKAGKRKHKLAKAEGSVSVSGSVSGSDNTPQSPPRGADDVMAEKKQSRFQKPSVEEVAAYVAERRADGKPYVDAESFCDFYEGKGWMIGKNKMKDWRAAVRTWEKNSRGGSEAPVIFGAMD